MKILFKNETSCNEMIYSYLNVRHFVTRLIYIITKNHKILQDGSDLMERTRLL
jgi:hypothetical protein